REAIKHNRGFVRKNEFPDAWTLPRPPREDGEEATENDISEGAPGLNPYPVRPRRPHASKTIREGGETEHDQEPNHSSPKLLASHSNSPRCLKHQELPQHPARRSSGIWPYPVQKCDLTFIYATGANIRGRQRTSPNIPGRAGRGPEK